MQHDNIEKKAAGASDFETSTEILKNILNGMDAYIYVSDPQTDKILFINDKMRLHFNLKPGEGVGSVCWKVLQQGFTERCSFCPNFKLEKDPSSSVVWEEHNTVTNHYYKNTDSFIDWTGGRKVHLQHSVDITEIKLAEKNLEKRLKQQALMTAISINFISKEKTEVQIEKALAMVGQFIGVDTVGLCQVDKKKQTLNLLEYWSSSGHIESHVKTAPFGSDSALRKAFIDEKLPYVIAEDLSSREHDYLIARSLGVKSIMVLPVYEGGEFWGVLFIASHTLKNDWSESDRHLGRLMASVLSGAISRDRVQRLLVKMSSLVTSSPQYTSCTDLEGRFTYFNPAVLKITGYSAIELLEKGIAAMQKDGAGVEKTKTQFIPNILKNGSAEAEIVLDTKYGSRIIMAFTGFLIDKSKMEIGYIATDITKQRQMEKDIIKAKETAESANMAKSDFLARMSHEIRTPINAIIGMTNIGKNSQDKTKKDYCFDKIDVASTHLLGIINDILDMAKIEANKFELIENEFDFERMVEKVVNVINFRVEQKHQTLIINIEQGLPRTVIGDEVRLGQVITNLLTNATKFTSEYGMIKVNVSKYAQAGERITLKIEVQDNGIGISPEQQAKLFRSFEQGEGGIARKFGGTGLGLAISKNIVELMGGQISVKSQPGKGSVFSFTVNVGGGQPGGEMKLDPSIRLEDLKILVIDDSADIRNYFSSLMSVHSIKCDVAAGAEEALRLLNENSGIPYNMIFVDWMMPGVNGIELTKKIKSMQPKNCVVIMISSSHWSEISKDALSAGVDKFISKPLFASYLINAINESLSGIVSHSKEEARKSNKPDFNGRSILIAEDVDVNREIMLAFLEETNIKIDFAFDGRKAVEAFKAAPNKYSLILMDVQMPEIDGLEATRQIRALNIESAKNIPIVAMTANVFAEDVKNCLEAGMNDHIGKPIDMDVMFEKLRRYMFHLADAPSASLQPKEQDAPPQAANLVQKPASEADYMPYINVPEGLNRLMNNKKLYFKLLGSFDGKKFSAEISEAVKSGDYQKLFQAGHTLKGVAANLGLKTLAELALAFESHGKQKTDASDLLPKLEQAAEKTKALIDALTKS